jgi:hypothetical protein
MLRLTLLQLHRQTAFSPRQGMALSEELEELLELVTLGRPYTVAGPGQEEITAEAAEVELLVLLELVKQEEQSLVEMETEDLAEAVQTEGLHQRVRQILGPLVVQAGMAQEEQVGEPRMAELGLSAAAAAAETGQHFLTELWEGQPDLTLHGTLPTEVAEAVAVEVHLNLPLVVEEDKVRITVAGVAGVPQEAAELAPVALALKVLSQFPSQ